MPWIDISYAEEGRRRFSDNVANFCDVAERVCSILMSGSGVNVTFENFDRYPWNNAPKPEGC